MHHRHRMIAGGAVLVGLLAAASAAGLAQDPSPTRFVSEYRIGPKDQLEIKVAMTDRFNTLVRVTEDGKITINYIGEVAVENLTTSELEKKLAQILIDKGMVLNPQVQVSVKDFQSSMVSVLGAVKEPGMVQLMGRQTLMQQALRRVAETPNLSRDVYEVVAKSLGETPTVSCDSQRPHRSRAITGSPSFQPAEGRAPV